MNRQETAQLLALAAAAFPMFPVTKEQIALYAELLDDIPVQTGVAAMKRLLTTTDRFPSVAALRREVAREHGALCPGKAQAWAEVREQIRVHGNSGRPSWSHPVLQEAVRAVGWWELCMSTNPETTRAHFLKVYEEMSQTRDQAVLSEPHRIGLEARARLGLEAS